MAHHFPRIGPLTVLQSAAGFYIGRLYYYSADEGQPYDRVSTYMADEETARQALTTNSYVEIIQEV